MKSKSTTFWTITLMATTTVYLAAATTYAIAGGITSQATDMRTIVPAPRHPKAEKINNCKRLIARGGDFFLKTSFTHAWCISKAKDLPITPTPKPEPETEVVPETKPEPETCKNANFRDCPDYNPFRDGTLEELRLYHPNAWQEHLDYWASFDWAVGFPK